MFKKCYHFIMAFADKPTALWSLGIVTFLESFISPFPPDPLYVAMLLKQKERAWFLATFCTLISVIGGWIGYVIGYALYESVGLWTIQTLGLEQGFASFQEQFHKWGFWIIAAKGLTPIPYKIVTIACGLIKLDLFTFTTASFVARGLRFFSLATLFYFYGDQIRDRVEKNLVWLTLASFFVILGGMFVVKFL
ncbi:MAG: YqaA family protein [Alphaproteobacteria bacterium]